MPPAAPGRRKGFLPAERESLRRYIQEARLDLHCVSCCVSFE